MSMNIFILTNKMLDFKLKVLFISLDAHLHIKKVIYYANRSRGIYMLGCLCAQSDFLQLHGLE